jgi:hypothetical protein
MVFYLFKENFKESYRCHRKFECSELGLTDSQQTSPQLVINEGNTVCCLEFFQLNNLSKVRDEDFVSMCAL